MAQKINVNFRADADKVAALDALAKLQDRDRSYLLNEAMENYLIHRRWMDDEIRKALAKAEAGELLTDAQVKAMYKRWGVE